MATTAALVNLRSELANARSRLQELISAYDQISISIENIRTQIQTVADQSTSVTDVQALEQARDTIQSSLQVLQSAQARQAQLENDVTAQQLVISGLESEITQLESQINNIQQQSSTQTAADAVNPPASALSQNTGTVTTSSEPLSDDEADRLQSLDIPVPEAPPPGFVSVDDIGSEIDNTESILNSAPTPVVSENPLHSLASYTYGISLHVLSLDDYKTTLNNPGSVRITKNIISSASRYSEQRVAEFQDDFYFDNLDIKTVIGLGYNSPATNAITLRFKILEPYGLTLINRLVDLSRSLDVKNYLEQPYLLEINFFGYDDSSESRKLPELTKFIPIKLIRIGIKASARGSEYDIEAIPYGQISQLESMQAIKANFEVTAKTVGEFFDKSLTTDSSIAVTATVDSQVQDDQLRTSLQQQGAAAATDGFDEGAEVDVTVVENQLNNLNSQPTPTVTVNSFAGAYNLWMTQEASHGYMEIPDQIEFEISNEIAAATISDPAKLNPKSAGAALSVKNTDTTDTGNSPDTQNSTPKQGPDFTRSIVSINAGTSITTVLNNLIINSSYITDQMIGAETDKQTGDTLTDLLSNSGGTGVKWFKIIPIVEILGFDKLRNTYAKKVKYYVRTYIHYNNNDPRAPKSLPPGAVKQYDYIYTGNNNDIIDFNIEFNALYATVINVSRSKTEILNQSGGASHNRSFTTLEPQPSGSVQPNQNIYISGSQNSLTAGAADDADKILARGYADSIYTNAQGDMINVRLKIVGDPDYIKQDEFLYNPGNLGLDYNGQYLPGAGNSLNMDSSELFCEIKFRSPVDIDEGTGMMRQDNTQNTSYSTSYFSGFYKIITVENSFSRGKFTQVLDLVRYFNQPGDSPGSGSISADSDRGVSEPTNEISLEDDLQNYEQVSDTGLED